MKPVLVLFGRETGHAAARSALQHELQVGFLSKKIIHTNTKAKGDLLVPFLFKLAQ
jgi:hypothetical protein